MPRTSKEIPENCFEAKLHRTHFKSRIYDLNLGSGTAHAGFVQLEVFSDSRGGKIENISKDTQQSKTTNRPSIMNPSIRGIQSDFDKEHADTFRDVQHADLRTDYIFARPSIT